MKPADLLAAIKNTPKMSMSLDELTCLRTLLRLEYTTRVLGAVLDAAEGKMAPEAVTEELLGTNQTFNTLDTPLIITESGALMAGKAGSDVITLPINAKIFDILHEVANSTLLSQRPKDLPMSPAEALVTELVVTHQPGLKAKFAEFAATFAGESDIGNVAGTDAPKTNIPAPKSSNKALLN